MLEYWNLMDKKNIVCFFGRMNDVFVCSSGGATVSEQAQAVSQRHPYLQRSPQRKRVYDSRQRADTIITR